MACWMLGGGALVTAGASGCGTIWGGGTVGGWPPALWGVSCGVVLWACCKPLP